MIQPERTGARRADAPDVATRIEMASLFAANASSVSFTLSGMTALPFGRPPAEMVREAGPTGPGYLSLLAIAALLLPLLLVNCQDTKFFIFIFGLKTFKNYYNINIY